MSTLVYRFGLLPPTHNGDMADRHLRAAHRYRNMLTEVERGRRSALRIAEHSDPALAGLDGAIAWLNAECTSLAKAAKAARSSARTRKISKALREQLKDARARVKRAKRCRGIYRAWWSLPRLQGERDRINNLAADLRRSCRRNRRALTGELIYHGTYTAVEDADAAARKAPLCDDPRFRRWTGDGILGAQIQGGATAADIYGDGHTQLQIARSTTTAKPCRPGKPGTHKRCTSAGCTRHERDTDRKGSVTPTRSRRPDGRLRILRMRQESDANRKPIWVEWPMVMHRSLPEGARVMRCNVQLRMVPGDMGPREEWYATMTLRIPDTDRRNDGLAVAIDVGWRALPDGSMRVAYWRGEDGRHDQLVLTAHQIAGLTKADSIRSIRDRNRDVMSAQIIVAIDAITDRPEWMTEARRWMPQWRASWRFDRLASRWADTGAPVPAVLSEWVLRDRHLAAYEHGQRSGSLRQRRDYYRRFAAWLTDHYDVAVLEKFDKRAFTKSKPAEDGAKTEDVELHHAQRLACTSVLCSVIASRFGQRGRCVSLPAEYTTLDCAVAGCGDRLVGDPADGITQRCGSGHVWDQDDNACRNLLVAYRERSGDDVDPGTARSGKDAKSESRWQRARRMRSEKDERVATARREGSDAAE